MSDMSDIQQTCTQNTSTNSQCICTIDSISEYIKYNHWYNGAVIITITWWKGSSFEGGTPAFISGGYVENNCVVGKSYDNI